MTIDKTLDTQGLSCPLPILKLKKAIGDMPAGSTLEMLATDPGSVGDIQAFCRHGRHTLLSHDESDGVFRFVIQRAA